MSVAAEIVRYRPANGTDGAMPRTEVLWLNPALVKAMGHGPLFDLEQAEHV